MYAVMLPFDLIVTKSCFVLKLEYQDDEISKKGERTFSTEI